MEEEENKKPASAKAPPGNPNTFKNGILSIIGAVFHKIVIMSMMVFLGFSTYMISYLRYYQKPNETPITLNYTYFIMPILSITMGLGIPFSGILEFKLGTRLTIIYSSLYLILSSVIQYFSKNFILNLIAIFVFAVGLSLSIIIPGKNACMYFPKRRGMISGILSCISAIISSFLNIFGERVIINPDSINPFMGYYTYEAAKNIRKYYLFQIFCVSVFTILTVLFIVGFKMKGRGPPHGKRGRKSKKKIISDEENNIDKEPLAPAEEGIIEDKDDNAINAINDNENENENENDNESNKEKKENKKNEYYALSGLEPSLANASVNYSMKQVKTAARSFRVWRLFLMGIFNTPLNNFITIAWRPISINKNMPTDKIQNVNSYTSMVQMFTTPLFGYLSDKIPFRVLKVSLGIIYCIVGFLFYFSFDNVDFFIILIVLNSFSHFGMFTLNEPHYMKVFGMKHFIEIAGIIGLSNVIMGPVCSIFAFSIEQNFKDNIDNVYKYMFMISSALTIVDIGLSFFETEDPLFED